jgi:hypothetical protein
MIEAMELLLKHWGEQCRHAGEAGGMGSPMATIMEWGGCAPRGTPGSRILLGGGAGPDAIAQEIGAALSEIARQDGRGERLQQLAVMRYGFDPAPTWAAQMHELGYVSKAKQTYYDCLWCWPSARTHVSGLPLVGALYLKVSSKLRQSCVKLDNRKCPLFGSVLRG